MFLLFDVPKFLVIIFQIIYIAKWPMIICSVMDSTTAEIG